jgi:hypothetical protein
MKSHHHQRPNLSGERDQNSHGLSGVVEYNQVGANKRSWYTSRPSDLHRAIPAHFDVMENMEVYMCKLYDVPILLKTLNPHLFFAFGFGTVNYSLASFNISSLNIRPKTQNGFKCIRRETSQVTYSQCLRGNVYAKPKGTQD